MSFAAQIATFSTKTSDRVNTTRRAICLRLFNAIIQDTPVDTGRLRGNWQLSLRRPKRGEIERFDKTGVQALRLADQEMRGARGDVTVYFVNNLPYAARIEFTGYSRQSPEGMVRKNIARINSLVNQAITEGRLQVT